MLWSDRRYCNMARFRYPGEGLTAVVLEALESESASNTSMIILCEVSGIANVIRSPSFAL